MSNRPKPTELKKLAGNPGHYPLNAAEPRPAQGEPPMPEGLSDAARAEWQRIVPELTTLGLLTVIDGSALAAYCENYATWFEATLKIEEYGVITEVPIMKKIKVIGDDGKTVYLEEPTGYLALKKNPAVTVRNEAMKLMKSFLVEFGMTPASRSKLHVEGAKEENPLDAWLKQQSASSKPSDC
jgi:P27 family predicted phage terminase small subunit